jgi:hypothetical protein
MANDERDTQGIGNRKTNLEINKDEDDSRRGMGIANDETTPNTLISDDSKNTIADQDHHGSDNNPNSGRAR